MNVLISVDMEGISGVVLWDHVTPDRAEYARFRHLMTAETNAAVEGALAGGATRVVVNDSHDRMTNLLIEELHPAAELITGSPKPFSMMAGIDSGVDRAFFVGYHAAAGTTAAVLSHTWSGAISQLWLNGHLVGETGLNAALAGAFNVPVTLVTGDRAVTEEARALLGAALETVAVKDGLSHTAARCLHPEEARGRIRRAAERAMRASVAPFALTPPINLRVVFQRPLHADQAAIMPGCVRVDERTVEWSGPDMPTAYRAWEALTSLIGAD